MRFRSSLASSFFLAALAFSRPSDAQNPIVQTNYTADPAPLVHEGRVYVYVSHDEDVTVNNFFTMHDWRVYSSDDMANWTDHGSPLGYRSFSWASGDAWASQAIYRNGKFYWYITATQRGGGAAIGVAVSDSPTGPFEDARGTALVNTGGGNIDPSVFIDDDGQAYLYWGNPNLKYVKLNEDMISYSGGIVSVPMTTASFGTRSGDASRATLYEEGPWFYRRGDLYYLVYAAGGIPEYISYSTSSGPTGPWTYRGVIMPQQGGSFTNHPGLVDFAGRSYFFYHNGALPGGGGYKRSVAVEEFEYRADGSFPTINMSREGVSQVAPLDPYRRVEAETIAWQSGVKTEVCAAGGLDVSNVEAGDYIKVAGVDFRSGAVSFEASVASDTSGGTLELRLDSRDGPLVGSCEVGNTGGWQEWETVSCEVDGATERHDLFLVFSGGGGFLFNLDWWRFTSNEPPDTGSGGASVGGAGAGGSTSSGGASANTGGGPSSAGAGGGLGEEPTEAAGCSCQTAPGVGARSSLALWALGGGLVLMKRRRARARPV